MSYLKSLLGALCIALIPAGVRGAEPVKIRVSWIAPITNWAPMLLEKKELARHLGQSYALEPVRFVGTPQMITALANNELEIANLAFSTLPIAIQNAGLKDLRVIADELQDATGQHLAGQIAIEHEVRGARANELARVRLLVVLGCVWIRNQDRGDAADGEFRDVAGPCSRNSHVGNGKRQI